MEHGAVKVKKTSKERKCKNESVSAADDDM
jgi:hypothetical protein